MAISPRHLVVKTSTIPGSGKGLFTKAFIPKGTRIAEYTGKVTAWKDADHEDGANGYIYYVKRSHVIDAKKIKNSIARYANDANGLTKVKGITNNCKYVEEGVRVYVHAKRDIEAGSEILVPYGPEYWQVIRYNRNLAIKESKAKEAKEKKQKTKALNGKSSKKKMPGRNLAKSKKALGKKTKSQQAPGKQATSKKGIGKVAKSKLPLTL